MSKYSAKSTNIEESDAPNRIGRERPILYPGIGRRIDAAAKLIGTRESAAKAAGISTDSLGYYVRESVEPRLKNMAMLAKAAGVSLDWLVFGDGMGAKEPGATYGTALEDDFALVPLYDVRASAGHGAINGNERILARMAFRRDWMRQTMGVSEDEVALVPVEGDSMEPTLPAGAVVLVDMREASRQVTREGIYLIRMDDGLMVKRAQRMPGNKLRIASDNPAYRPFELDLNAEHPGAEILGRVIWNGHPM